MEKDQAEKSSALLRKITSKKNKNDFYCLNCLHSFRKANKLKYHESYIKIKAL